MNNPHAPAISVCSAITDLPLEVLSMRVRRAIIHYGLGDWPLARLIKELQAVARLQQQGWSLEDMRTCSYRQVRNVPVIARWPKIGPVGLRELMQAFLPLSAPAASVEALEVA